MDGVMDGAMDEPFMIHVNPCMMYTLYVQLCKQTLQKLCPLHALSCIMNTH